METQEVRITVEIDQNLKTEELLALLRGLPRMLGNGTSIVLVEEERAIYSGEPASYTRGVDKPVYGEV